MIPKVALWGHFGSLLGHFGVTLEILGPLGDHFEAFWHQKVTQEGIFKTALPCRRELHFGLKLRLRSPTILFFGGLESLWGALGGLCGLIWDLKEALISSILPRKCFLQNGALV